MNLTVDTSWYTRYRSAGNPDFGDTFPQIVNLVDLPAVPNRDLPLPADPGGFKTDNHRARQLRKWGPATLRCGSSDFDCASRGSRDVHWLYSIRTFRGSE